MILDDDVLAVGCWSRWAQRTLRQLQESRGFDKDPLSTPLLQLAPTQMEQRRVVELQSLWKALVIEAAFFLTLAFIHAIDASTTRILDGVTVSLVMVV